jgi:hypothetical protein
MVRFLLRVENRSLFVFIELADFLLAEVLRVESALPPFRQANFPFSGAQGADVFRRRGCCRAGEHDVSLGRFDPPPAFVQMGVNAGGADNHACQIGAGVFDALENLLEDAGEFMPSAGEKPRSVGVAVDGGTVGDFVVFCNLGRTAPADELAFDGVAVGMRTDGASASVAAEIGRDGAEAAPPIF